MTAPAPSPYEQAEIERFGIFDEERVVEEVARALRDLVPELGARALTWERSLDVARRLVGDPRVAAAVTAYRAQDGGAEEAVRRVEWESCPRRHASEVQHLVDCAALTPQAGDGAR